MIRYIALLGLVISCCCAFQTIEDTQFTSFVNKYKKEYYLNGDRFEYLARFETFKNNLKYINEHNAKNTGTTLGITEFADMTNEEFKKAKKGNTKPLPNKAIVQYDDVIKAPLPDSFNWEDKGVVGIVKNQGQCGSSLLIASVDAISSAFCYYF